MRTVYVSSIPSPFDRLNGLIWYKETWSGHGLWGHEGGASGVVTAMFLSEVDSTGVIILANEDWDWGLFRTLEIPLFDESRTLTVVAHKDIAAVPERFQLMQNYPNPFNPTTVIAWQQPVAGHVRLVMYDLQGREVETLVDDSRNAGTHSVRWNASGRASGVYFYRLVVGETRETRRLVLIQ
jgi:hypothetical protein